MEQHDAHVIARLEYVLQVLAQLLNEPEEE